MDKAKYKIAYFHQDGLITGSAISLRNFLSKINRNIFEPVIVLAQEGPARDLFEKLNIYVLVLKFRTFWTFPGPKCFSRDMFYQLTSLFPDKFLRNYILNVLKPDLIHINDKAGLNVGITMYKSGIPIIQHSRSTYYSTSCNFSKLLSKKAINNYADCIICISEDEVDGFENNPNKVIIYNTVDIQIATYAKTNRVKIRSELRVNNDEYLIGFAANINEKKGAWDFLELCNRLKNIPKLKFIMVGQLNDYGKTNLGNGEICPLSPREFIDEYTNENGLKEKLIITGHKVDILNYIAAMDIIVVPNKNGVLGRQPIEAQAIGIPVIATIGHSGNSQIIMNKKTGYLVNNINEAINKVKYIIDNNAFNEMSIEAMLHAKNNFNPEINIKKIEQIYLNLISH